jgi:hypothetical protein
MGMTIMVMESIEELHGHFEGVTAPSILHFFSL